MTIRLDGRVAIVTGAGTGLGRAHALLLATRGAKVVVNDLGAMVDGHRADSAAALAVVAEISAAGGQAIAHGANVADHAEVSAMVALTMSTWGRIDILVNNAGILRDKSFTKMTLDDYHAVMKVHVDGSFHCTKAVWDIMREQKYGRIVMTTSSSGMYGNFGQSNYGAAKMAVLGLMNTLVIEGEKHCIRVNALAPTAATQMTEGLIDSRALALMTPESVSAGLLVLCAEDAPNRLILCCGAGGYASTHIYETDGIYLAPSEQSPENVLARLEQISARKGEQEFKAGLLQTQKFVTKAAHALAPAQ